MISGISSLILGLALVLLLVFAKRSRRNGAVSNRILKETFGKQALNQDGDYQWEEGEWLVDGQAEEVEATRPEPPVTAVKLPEKPTIQPILPVLPVKQADPVGSEQPTSDAAKSASEFQDELSEPFLSHLHLIEPASILLPDSMSEQRRLAKHAEQKELRHRLSQRLYETSKHKIGIFHELNLEQNRAPIYFTDGWYRSFFEQAGYSIEVVAGKTLSQLLDEVQPSHTILLSVKDEGSQALTSSVRDQLMQQGIRLLSPDHQHFSYVNVIQKKGRRTYESIAEVLQEGLIDVDPDTHPILEKLPSYVSVLSAGAHAGNRSSILINGQEHSKNERGINIVVLDTQGDVVLSTFVDTYATLWAENTLYVARRSQDPESYIWARNHPLIAPIIDQDFENMYRIGYRAFVVNLMTKELQKACQLMCTYKDISLVIETHSTDLGEVCEQYQKWITTAQEIDASVLQRIIPQVSDQEMYDALRKMYPFTSWIYAPRDGELNQEELMWFAYQNGLLTVAVTDEQFSPELADMLAQKGILLYVKGISHPQFAPIYFESGAHGLFTDRLVPAEVANLKIRLQVQREVLLDTLRKYWSIEYPEQTVNTLLETARSIRSVNKLDNIVLGIFKMDNLAGIKDLLSREAGAEPVASGQR